MVTPLAVLGFPMADTHLDCSTVSLIDATHRCTERGEER